MRKGLITLLAIGALASVALCASYGWDQAAVFKDRLTSAFIYGFVALATLALHGLALRMWVSGWRKAGAFVGAVGLLAFTMTAFTSLGGLASRTDAAVAERQDTIDIKKDLRKQIDDLTTEKTGLGKFARTTADGVLAAKRKAEAAKLAKDRECGDGSIKQRGPFCRQKEDAEGTANGEVTTAEAHKASTDRANAIDAEIKGLRTKLGEAGAIVGSADPLKALLTAIFGTIADIMVGWQKAAFAVIYDLVLVALMIGIEVLGSSAAAAPVKQREARWWHRRKPTVDISPEPAGVPVVAKPSAQVVDEIDPQPVIDFMVRRLRQAKGAAADWGHIYGGYLADWEERGETAEPLTAAEFGQVLRYICEKANIRIERRGSVVVCLDRKLVA